MASGGYRAPANPAPVSGPGGLSRRTDGAQPVMELTNLPYGDAQAFRAQEASALIPQTQQALAAPVGGGVPTAPMPSVVGLGEPSQFPNEPITAGAPFGAGPGRPVSRAGFRVTDLLGALMGSDIAGDVADLYLQAERMGL